MSADTEMEGFLSGDLDEVLVGANTGRLQRLGAQLLILVRDQVDAEGEIVDGGTLSPEVEDPDLRVGHTTVEPGFGIRLEKDRKRISDRNKDSLSRRSL